MNFKIDTKEKFHEISINEPHLSANMTAALTDLFATLEDSAVKNVVLSLKNVNQLDTGAANALAAIQQQFYESSRSFVICCLQPAVESMLDAGDLLEQMNTTPTVSEAKDIVQMEEIERELLDDF